ncbi:MAG: MGMT family protein [Methanobacterium sp.]|nr:MGMT family protein [Methanobacterium sp.]
MNKKSENSIIISTYKDRDLYFAVGYSEIGKIIRIALPQKNEENAVSEISKYYPEFLVSDQYSNTAKLLSDIYHGKNVEVKLELLDFSKSTINTSFEMDVIREVVKIPYGNIITYKEIAKSLNSQAYRAVGTAIGKNPFPILIPCHRVIRSDGKIGDFQGGTPMKMEILKNEGIKIHNFKIMNSI